MELVGLVSALVALALAAAHWGTDSTETVDSTEWQRRQAWRPFGGNGA